MSSSMSPLQLQFQVSPATLLLLLCLQLGISTAPGFRTPRRAIILDVDMPQEAKSDEEVTLTLNIQTELRECMVPQFSRMCDLQETEHDFTEVGPLVKTYLQSTRPIDGAFNSQYITCLCNDYSKNVSWNFRSKSTVQVATLVDVMRELDICPDDQAVVPIKVDRFYTVNNLVIK